MTVDHAVLPQDLELGDHIYVWSSPFHRHHGIVVQKGTEARRFWDARVVDVNQSFHVASWTSGAVRAWVRGWCGQRNFDRSVSGASLVQEGQPSEAKMREQLGDELGSTLFTYCTGGLDRPQCNKASLKACLGEGWLFTFTKHARLRLCKVEYHDNIVFAAFKAITMPGISYHSVTPLPPEQVVQSARQATQRGLGAYHLLENNCESFANLCKVGQLVTVQGQEGPARVLEVAQSATSGLLRVAAESNAAVVAEGLAQEVEVVTGIVETLQSGGEAAAAGLQKVTTALAESTAGKAMASAGTKIAESGVGKAASGAISKASSATTSVVSEIRGAGAVGVVKVGGRAAAMKWSCSLAVGIQVASAAYRYKKYRNGEITWDHMVRKNKVSSIAAVFSLGGMCLGTLIPAPFLGSFVGGLLGQFVGSIVARCAYPDSELALASDCTPLEVGAKIFHLRWPEGSMSSEDHAPQWVQDRRTQVTINDLFGDPITKVTVQATYRQLMLQFHPDKVMNITDKEFCKQISQVLNQGRDWIMQEH